MRIALCDDEPRQREMIAALIKSYQEMRPDAEIKLSIFSSGAELLGDLEDHSGYDLYLLDIVMPSLNGIEVGLLLRAQHDQGLIVYLTVSPDFAIDSYQVQAFHYLLKPLTQSRLFEVLDKAYTQIEQRKATGITIKTQGGSMRLLPLHTILYAELTGRSVRYYLTIGQAVNGVTFRGSFQNEIALLLTYDSFVLCSSSFAVNLRHTIEVRKSDLVLSDGSLVPVSRNLYSKVKKQWMQYWLERR